MLIFEFVCYVKCKDKKSSHAITSIQEQYYKQSLKRFEVDYTITCYIEGIQNSWDCDERDIKTFYKKQDVIIHDIINTDINYYIVNTSETGFNQSLSLNIIFICQNKDIDSAINIVYKRIKKKLKKTHKVTVDISCSGRIHLYNDIENKVFSKNMVGDFFIKTKQLRPIEWVKPLVIVFLAISTFIFFNKELNAPDLSSSLIIAKIPITVFNGLMGALIIDLICLGISFINSKSKLHVIPEVSFNRISTEMARDSVKRGTFRSIGSVLERPDEVPKYPEEM